MSARRGHAARELELGVGEYVYDEASRPEVRGALLVEPPVE